MLTQRNRPRYEAKIRKHISGVIASLGNGDAVDIGLFCLSERSVVKALLNAAHKGAAIWLLDSWVA